MKGKIYSIGYTKTYVILNVGVLFERAGVDSSAWRRTAFDRRDEGIDLIAGSDGFDIDTPIILVPDDSRNAYLVSHHFPTNTRSGANPTNGVLQQGWLQHGRLGPRLKLHTSAPGRIGKQLVFQQPLGCCHATPITAALAGPDRTRPLPKMPRGDPGLPPGQGYLA